MPDILTRGRIEKGPTLCWDKLGRPYLKLTLALDYGNTFTVLMSRQAGKNELSAWIEKVLLVANMANRAAVGVKTAPTLTPQLRNSIRRLRAHLDAAGFRNAYALEEGHLLTLGAAAWNFLSASPGASVLGATAGLLLEADEAQDIDR